MKNGRFWRILILLTLLLILLGWLGGWYYRSLVYSPFGEYSSGETISFAIEPGEQAVSVANRLEEKGLVSSAFWFRLYLKLAGERGVALQAGEYDLVFPVSIAELVERLRHGSFTKRLTFIEGWRREQYAAYLTNQFSLQSAQFFMDESGDDEGYLFPDTYLVEQDFSVTELLSLLRATYERKVDEGIRLGFQNQGLTVEQAVILASVVEREAKHAQDRPLVAGILIKRFKNGWPLEADATVQYVLGTQHCQWSDQECEWWPNQITQADLEVDSPYNTRKHVGLPPGPISSPGLAAIQAVAGPQASEYWYYLSDQEGEMHYARTLEEHNSNIQTYLR